MALLVNLDLVRILVTGASGQLGPYLLRVLQGEPHIVTAWSGNWEGELFGTPMRPVDLASPGAVEAAFTRADPEVVIHAGAVASPGVVDQDPDRAWTVNVQGTDRLAGLCESRRCRLLYVSTDMVFDGEDTAYDEDSPPRPVSAYGRSKLAAEPLVLGRSDLEALVVRVSLMFGPSLNGRPRFFDQLVEAIRQGRPFTLFNDEWRSPLSLDAAARALAALASQAPGSWRELGSRGVLHIGGAERMTRHEMGVRIAGHLGCDSPRLAAGSRLAHESPEPRPRDLSLDSRAWRTAFPDLPWPSLEEALGEMLPPGR